MKGPRHYGFITGALLACSMLSNGSLCQTYPSKPIRLQTSTAGANPDFVARAIAGDMAASLGQPVIVENRATGFAAPSGVAKAAPDGYTLLVIGGTLWTGPLFEQAPYDVFRDLAPITTLATSPNILVVNPSVEATSVAELIKLAKARPGQLNYSSGSNGSVTHLAGELLKSLAGVDIVRVPYKSQSQENADLMSGRIQLSFGAIASLGALVKSGKLRAVATGGAKRSSQLPDLPAVAETLPNYASESVLALFAPAKTPESIIARLNQQTNAILARGEVRARLLNTGLEPVGGSTEQLAQTIKSDVDRVSKLAKEIGLPLVHAP